jgi:eukaryotic-like serine/threonine-protein kinase
MELPRNIGRYEVIERVARGGMSLLYHGRDPVFDREVAVKVMLGDFSTDETARTRFFREARAAARLQHRNIVTIFEFAEDGGTPYIAMEFLRGRSLAQRMAEPPEIPLIQKLDIIIQLSTGLHYAHEHGIVHREVKPASIWLMDDGTVKLLDFGIARIGAPAMTSAGSVPESASYMAPEQVSGSEVDGRADVFAAGVVLYELLSGRQPFEADSPAGVMMKIVHEEPTPLMQFSPNLPPQLLAAVTRALQKDPDRRFVHAGDFGAELRLVRLALERASGTAAESPDAAGTAALSGGAVTAAQPITATVAASRGPAWAIVALVGAVAIATAIYLLLR